MKIEFVASSGAAEILAVLAHEGRALAGAGSALDQAASGALAKAMKNSRFTGAANSTLNVAAPAGIDANAVLLVGAGAADKLDDLAVETAAATAYQATKLSGAEVLTIEASHLSPELAARAGFAVRLAAYRFAKYLTKQKADKIPSVTTVRVVTSDVKAAEAAFQPLSAVADAVLFSRDLVSEPANILYPAEFARRVKELEALGAKVEILGEAEMKKLGMGSLLGVGQGSVRESQLAVIQWNGGKAGEAPIAFVGKGVCFDTGGISLKPADGMEEMKWDMGGAAAVAGLMHALVGRKAKVNVVGVLGLVENMPDGNAQRPGDVVTSMSGQTIEVLNTDAEGRLVLADALWYTQDRFKPKFMIDLATLTGAIIISLGLEYAGVFTNSDELAANIADAGPKVGEKSWRLPIPAEYERHIDSPIADVKNMGNGRAGGSITAALFLQRFTNGTPWAHIDIASTAWVKDSKNPTVPDGAVGYGVRLLDRMVADHYEG
ncbi:MULTISPECIES: leucyl aminopeptidase [Brevundimonas]|jgi:leucyl aminopeptidase|uniref:leucyl aminopeptidase n=1 Tax=Brevundimonas TaxID=41275 RepID=UPI001907EE14|nr:MULTISPECIES: leucyl aminopeptidase [Brevundimonas]MBK1968969.1 leucyl aminopeptidase [Brevundimonas diminuta]MBK1975128.1 leucyl aminopeptidase [Brevundimonas diminuta]MDA0743458.1 leucyl aminopeptidase [Pseudomonadota bacterium]MDM8351558.1 leucyl aminopeptidase [Brevundimonas diminuta]